MGMLKERLERPTTRKTEALADDVLKQHRRELLGHVLVSGFPPEVVSRAGGAGVERVDLVDADPFNLSATVVADLREEGSLPEALYDCCILAGTPESLTEVALRNVWQALKPGGVLLIVPDRQCVRLAKERS